MINLFLSKIYLFFFPTENGLEVICKDSFLLPHKVFLTVSGELPANKSHEHVRSL